MAEPEWPTRGAGGADAWQGGHADARGGAPRGKQVSEGPTGIVGPGK